jgi:hypothetical protein
MEPNPTIMTISTELVEHIASFMPPVDIMQFRLSNAQFAKKTVRVFVKRCFTEMNCKIFSLADGNRLYDRVMVYHTDPLILSTVKDFTVCYKHGQGLGLLNSRWLHGLSKFKNLIDLQFSALDNRTGAVYAFEAFAAAAHFLPLKLEISPSVVVEAKRSRKLTPSSESSRHTRILSRQSYSKI